ncbi:glycosyltransferase family 2 protein [Hyalangium rubrum]|uniref:Glycosyltransferase family 2 protein n=1 Tax=Hyalangium rubrum TaxID=3103134 RepID=A0ABU5HCK3_9BACT|nr:glycosyltransferase family 2 protein [Hyalangium sp. s54d21]MDY7230562.1 glycosyltransferase family 2 protein [Hyalangium sp. s54d21]
MSPTVAVLIPCLNEEVAISKVVSDFRAALPEATVYVYDNASTDRTAEVARAAGAVVRVEPVRGKGNVVRRMFADVEADVYVLVDGDDTYQASAAPRCVEWLVREQLDMLNVARVTEIEAAYRRGHRFGNAMLTGMVATLFGNRFRDILSGYRVFSRRFIKSFPALAAGFEIETELTVHALELRMPVAEAEAVYKDRPAGSASKLRTFSDGWRILRMILRLLKQERPLLFFSVLAGLLALVAVVLAVPIFITFHETGLVPRLPTAVLSTGIMMLASLSLACGLVLDTVTRGRQELKRLHYLAIPAVGQPEAAPVRRGVEPSHAQVG